jgi:hypothetical protein
MEGVREPVRTGALLGVHNTRGSRVRFRCRRTLRFRPASARLSAERVPRPTALEGRRAPSRKLTEEADGRCSRRSNDARWGCHAAVRWPNAGVPANVALPGGQRFFRPRRLAPGRTPNRDPFARSARRGCPRLVRRRARTGAMSASVMFTSSQSTSSPSAPSSAAATRMWAPSKDEQITFDEFVIATART